jgi:hypothetical protein
LVRASLTVEARVTYEQILTGYGTALSATFAAVSIFLAYLVYRRQCNVQVFLEYTKRYAEIMNSFPSHGREARLELFGDPPAESPELSLSVLRYLNLCSEEFYLRQKKYLSVHVWRIWEAELNRTLRSALVVREWRRLSREFQSYPEFLAYVEGVQCRASAEDARLTRWRMTGTPDAADAMSDQ